MKLSMWAAFAAFVGCAWWFDRHPEVPAGPFAAGRYVVWAVFAAFLAYTVWCSVRENLGRSTKQVLMLHWGRQFVTDLYLGLFLMTFVVFLHEGSVLAALLWLVPAAVFGNLATLVYVALHYDGLVARFTG